MSAPGMSEAGGLREAVEALADQLMAQGCHHCHQQGETDECNACTASDFAALLAAHPAPEADPTAGEGCPCGDPREHGPHDDPLPATPDAGDASDGRLDAHIAATEHPTPACRDCEVGEPHVCPLLPAGDASKSGGMVARMTDPYRGTDHPEWPGDASTSAGEPLSEDVEALAKALLTRYPDGYPSPLQSDYHRRLVARAILASDWFAAREAKARAEAGEQIAQAIEAIFWRHFEPDMAGVDWRDDAAIQAFAAEFWRYLRTIAREVTS